MQQLNKQSLNILYNDKSLATINEFEDELNHLDHDIDNNIIFDEFINNKKYDENYNVDTLTEIKESSKINQILQGINQSDDN